MRTQTQWLAGSLVCFAAVLAGCQKTAKVSAQQSTAPASLPQKLDEATNKKRIDMQTFQINQSQLPAAEKQRLIQQIQASTPR